MKSLFKNSIYNLAYKFFLLVFPLISSVYVSRILLPAGVGKVAYAQNIVSYFITFAGLGVSTYGVREIGKVQQNKAERTKTFTELFGIILTTTVFACVLYFSWILLLRPFDNIPLYIAAGFQLVFSAFNVDWFYQGMEEYKYITNRSILIKLLSLLFMFVAVNSSEDVVAYALMSSVALAGNNIINLVHIRKYIARPNFRKIEVKRHLKPLIILLSTNLTIELYTKLDTTCLGILAKAENVGYYNYATRISSIVVNLAAAMSTILLPRLSYYYKNNKGNELNAIVAKAHKAILTVAIPAMVGLFLVADDVIVLLFGTAFYPAAITVRILSVLVVVKSIGNLYGTQVLLTFGQEKLLLYTTIIGAVSNVAMNILMISAFQENGAAVASVISELIVCIVQIFIALRFVKPIIRGKEYISVIIPSIGMMLIVILIKTITKGLFVRILLSCFIGIAIYYILCILLKNDTMKLLNEKIFRRLKKDGC